MIPNYLPDVKAAKVTYADAWAHAHIEGDPRKHEFIKLLAADLHAKDPNVANNGKRGNPLDLSMDALNILCTAADSQGRTPDGLPCVVVDVIGGAGRVPPFTPSNPEPTPTWNVFTNVAEGSGARVVPTDAPDPPDPPQPPTIPPPGREEALDELNALDAYYQAPEGLQRPQGLSLNGKPDFEGVAAWYLDVYQRSRMAGKSRADARADYVKAIRQTDEWKQKHPGEQP